jgi:hypothetical protein
MKLLLIISMLSYYYVNCQIWKDPNDTLTYLEKLPSLEKNHLDVKSYSILQFDSSGNEVQFDFRQFNAEGLLIKSCLGISRNQKFDTTYYDYSIPIEYSDDNIVGEIKMEYYEDGKLRKKSTFENEQLTSYLHYNYPETNVISYTECHQFKVYDNLKTTCDSTIGFFNKKGKLEKVDSYFTNDSIVHSVYFEYDRKGRIMKITFEEITGKTSTEYIRNRRGLPIRIENRDKLGRVYNYSIFEYEYR